MSLMANEVKTLLLKELIKFKTRGGFLCCCCEKFHKNQYVVLSQLKSFEGTPASPLAWHIYNGLKRMYW